MIASITFDDISPAYLTASKLERLVGFIETLDVKCTFFVVPFDRCGSASQEFTLALEEALSLGHEIGLHGYKHIKNEYGIFYPVPLPVPFPSFKKQKERIEKGKEILSGLFGLKPKGFRAPYYQHNSATLKALSNLGFTYDSSATCFKTAHCSRFRVRWRGDYRPSVTNGIVEAPVTGDYTFNLESYGFSNSLRTAVRDFELAEASGGIFVMNNHPSRFRLSEFHLLEVLIKKLRARTAFQTLINAVQCFEKSCLTSQRALNNSK